jgi:hypothetical protein
MLLTSINVSDSTEIGLKQGTVDIYVTYIYIYGGDPCARDYNDFDFYFTISCGFHDELNIAVKCKG